MGICDANIEPNKNNEKISELPKYSMNKNFINFIYKAKKSICKIFYEKIFGAGFFVLLNNSFKCLITVHHVIPKSLFNNIVNIQIYNGKTIQILLNNRYIKFYENLDITIIEIKDFDGIVEDIDFLEYDLNYINSYANYLNEDLVCLQIIKGNSFEYSFSIGKITEIINQNEFKYVIGAIQITSGTPIILYNSLKVIGIHKGKDFSNNFNYGTFIGEIVKDNDLNNIYRVNNCIKNKVENNFIIGKIFISQNDIGKNIRIINSYEEQLRNALNNNIKEEFKNEKEIKECKIEINNEIIPFSYSIKFRKEGIYKIKYSFEKCLNNMSYIFYDCSSLTELDLSNFNTKNVTNMGNMFYRCSSLINLNLSNFNTKNVTDMSCMFSLCSSLTDLKLSNFNTENVNNMSFMFSGCSSLKNLDISNFNTQNVTNMSFMFYNCSSLTDLNLSKFNTQNVKNMNAMFYNCSSLTNLNLSNFNTQNVSDMSFLFMECSSLSNLNLSNFDTKNATNMNHMFYNCSSLIDLNLSNFNTQNVTDMSCMFSYCSSLSNLNLSNFNTQNVKNMGLIFYYCKAFEMKSILTNDLNLLNKINNLKNINN